MALGGGGPPPPPPPQTPNPNKEHKEKKQKKKSSFCRMSTASSPSRCVGVVRVCFPRVRMVLSCPTSLDHGYSTKFILSDVYGLFTFKVCWRGPCLLPCICVALFPPVFLRLHSVWPVSVSRPCLGVARVCPALVFFRPHGRARAGIPTNPPTQRHTHTRARTHAHILALIVPNPVLLLHVTGQLPQGRVLEPR